jgi:hypothetical protein
MTNRSGPLAGLACAAIVLASIAPSAHAATASAFGPEVTLGEAANGYVGALDVFPSHGAVGAPFTVKGSKLPPNQKFELVWTTVTGHWKVANYEYHGRDFAPVAYHMATVSSDAQGRIEATFVTPDDFGLDHDIVLQQGSHKMTQADYAIDFTVEIAPKSGPLGTPIHVTARGISWRSLGNSWDLLYDNNFTGWMSSVTTHGDADFTIPATGNVGSHVLEVIHGEYTFPYRNMQQTPGPQRPHYVRTFKITSGAPVLPQAPQLQGQTSVQRLPAPGDLVSSPRFSAVGEPITVSGSGLTPGRSYELNWTHVTGNRIDGKGWDESSAPLAKATADSAGRIAFRFKTPDDLGGTHALWLQDGATKKTGTHWIKASALPLDVAKGPPGTRFLVHLKGVGWTETSNILNVVYDNSYSGYVCAFNSQGDIQLFLRASGAPGWHFVDLYPGIYKGDEKDPNNFRIPQLTYAADHPGEDLAAFHFAFQVLPDGKLGAVKQANAQ